MACGTLGQGNQVLLRCLFMETFAVILDLALTFIYVDLRRFTSLLAIRASRRSTTSIAPVHPPHSPRSPHCTSLTYLT